MANRYGRYDHARRRARAKRRNTDYVDEAHLQSRRGTWHAVMPIPRDVQEIVGQSVVRKTRFTASLKTNNIEEARMRLPAYISLWKAQIAKARRISSRRPAANPWGTAFPND